MIYNLSDADLSIGERLTKKKANLVLWDECASEDLVGDCEGKLITFSDEGIILHGRVGSKIRQVQAVLDCMYSCLFTRYGLDTGTAEEQDGFCTLFPKEVEVWTKVTVSNGDKIHAADSIDEDLPDRRDATFVRVSKLSVV